MKSNMKKPKTQIYRHYKGKLYKYIGEFHHSESLEPLVGYRCLYDNPKGPLWVRPKDLFYSKLESSKLDLNKTGTNDLSKESLTRGYKSDLQKQEKHPLRFEPVSFDFKILESPSQNQLTSSFQLALKLFPEITESQFYGKIEDKKNVLLVSLVEDHQCVGFKIGYEQTPKTFYSWLGGVDENWRGLGMAQEMMDLQLEWAQQKNYKTIRTKTMNQWPDMLKLNITNDFKIVKLEKDSSGENLKIVMEKTIP